MMLHLQAISTDHTGHRSTDLKTERLRPQSLQPHPLKRWKRQLLPVKTMQLLKRMVVLREIVKMCDLEMNLFLSIVLGTQDTSCLRISTNSPGEAALAAHRNRQTRISKMVAFMAALFAVVWGPVHLGTIVLQ